MLHFDHRPAGPAVISPLNFDMAGRDDTEALRLCAGLFGTVLGDTELLLPPGALAGLRGVKCDIANLSVMTCFFPAAPLRLRGFGMVGEAKVLMLRSMEGPLVVEQGGRRIETDAGDFLFVSGGEATTGQYAQTAAGGSAQSGVDINNPDSQRRTSQIVNLIQIVGEDQVTLKVTVAEVSRSVMKQLGVNMIGQADGISFESLAADATSMLKAGTRGAGVGGASYLKGTMTAMEQSGVMKTLAEPTLSAISGEKATFKVGGEYNVLTDVSNENGVTTRALTQIDYGIGLEFQPVVLSAGRISLKVRTSVSEPTAEGAVHLAGNNILSLRKRLADTTVELPSGGSMMIAGLVNDDIRQTVNAVPGLTKIPVLGALFRSREFVRNESELVIIVTPYLARPVARNDLARPDDNFNPPSDGAGIFLGRVNRVYGTMKTDKPNGRYHGVVGFIYK